MIVSKAHKFVFFHNPKAGGTSVRASIEMFNDIGFGLWGLDPEQTQGRQIDRAHIGIDEFATYYPELWSEAQQYKMFCLYRDPVARFYSSVAEYSKLFGDVDLRFVGAEERPHITKKTVDMLRKFERAEAPELLEDHTLAHFRPQWIFARAPDPSITVQAFPVEHMSEMFAAIERLTGSNVDAQVRNERERLDLPGPLAALASSARIKRHLASVPGFGLAKAGARRLFSSRSINNRDTGLDDTEHVAIKEFVTTFYERDYATFSFETA